MNEYIKKSEAVDVIVKYPYDIAGKTATAIKMIEGLPSAGVVPKSTVESIIYQNSQLEAENERLNVELKVMRGAANSLKMHYEKAEAEVRRLRGILLQFTDIVHKWGAKNNIDTSEISLVPILQQEADSIIKKANQEYASEIFVEIEKHLIFNAYGIATISDKTFAELKKKYTEIEVEN